MTSTDPRECGPHRYSKEDQATPPDDHGFRLGHCVGGHHFRRDVACRSALALSRRLFRRCRRWHSAKIKGMGVDSTACDVVSARFTHLVFVLASIYNFVGSDRRARQSFDASTWRRHVTAHKLARGAPARAATLIRKPLCTFWAPAVKSKPLRRTASMSLRQLPVVCPEPPAEPPRRQSSITAYIRIPGNTAVRSNLSG